MRRPPTTFLDPFTGDVRDIFADLPGPTFGDVPTGFPREVCFVLPDYGPGCFVHAIFAQGYNVDGAGNEIETGQSVNVTVLGFRPTGRPGTACIGWNRQPGASLVDTSPLNGFSHVRITVEIHCPPGQDPFGEVFLVIVYQGPF